MLPSNDNLGHPHLSPAYGDDVAIDIESLSTKADGGSKNYKIFSEMLDDFGRLDVSDLHKLVKARYMTSSPEGYDLMLWGDLKTLFVPDEDDEVWRNQQGYNLISWRLFDSCGIHILLMDNGIAIHMMIEKKYPLTQEMLSKMLSIKLEVDHESTMAYELLRFIRSQDSQSSSVSSGFVSNMLNPSPDTGIDSIFNLNTKSTSLVDVPVIAIAEPPLLSVTTTPPPPTPLIIHLQQTPVPTPATVPSSSLQDLPNFGFLFGFDHRLKTLENNFSEFNQTNQFATTVSSIPGILDAYLANKMHEAVKIAVQLQSERLRDEAQAKNTDFINKLDDNIKKIIKD
ncbi:hypothetical protein Tco_0932804 [Tanacetum coccineum]